MLTLKGLATSTGIAQGNLLLLNNDEVIPEKKSIIDSVQERTRVDQSIEKAKQDLAVLYQKTLGTAGEATAAIFEIHSLMLEDEDFIGSIHGLIEEEKLCAEYAVYATGVQFAEVFENMEDEYMRERATDVRDLSQRIVDILSERTNPLLESITEPVIIAARDLLPSQTVLMDKSQVLAFVSQKGSYNSHASILARSLGIPAVSNLEDGFDQLKNNQFIIVDGIEGCVICEPDGNTFVQYKERNFQLAKEKERLLELKGTAACTKDGCCIEICANIGCPEEAKKALELDAQGVGLFRSEFLYLENDDFPTEEAQFQAYKETLEIMGSRRVIVRTLDLGADKQAPYFNLSKEENPALGYRAIRICLDQTDIFIPQLRALLRASVYGKLAVMFPMITGVAEIRSIKLILNKVKEDLTAEGIPFSSELEIGIMVETPAAVMMSDRLAKEVDFFSIGTNDLTQYTLAVDRMNSKIDYLFDPGHPAILRMVHQVVENAHKNGIWVGICGESAADPELIPFFVGIGVDELSMASPSILKIKEIVQGLNKAECEVLCEKTLRT